MNDPISKGALQSVIPERSSASFLQPQPSKHHSDFSGTSPFIPGTKPSSTLHEFNFLHPTHTPNPYQLPALSSHEVLPSTVDHFNLRYLHSTPNSINHNTSTLPPSGNNSAMSISPHSMRSLSPFHHSHQLDNANTLQRLMPPPPAPPRNHIHPCSSQVHRNPHIQIQMAMTGSPSTLGVEMTHLTPHPPSTPRASSKQSVLKGKCLLIRESLRNSATYKIGHRKRLHKKLLV